MENKANPFATILNFRDVAEVVNTTIGTTYLKTGLLYRGARPDEASPEDRKRLVNDYGIRDVIDLRTKTEHIQQAEKRDARIKSSAAVPQTNNQVAEPLKIPGVTYHEINFNGNAFSKMLINKLTWSEFGRLVWLMARGYRLDAIKILSPHMRAAGLVGLAKDSLDVCTKEVYQVFAVLAESGNWPVMLHCTQGKDRTGLTVMLVLILLGVPREAIEKDYLVSEPNLLSEKEERMKEIESIGLTEHFASCPPELVPEVLNHITEKYGSVEKYLLGVGVTTEMQETIKTMLLNGTDASTM
ncbi:tyrosine/serine phosphatase-like protein [Mytilinidion resinicola]|uniref:Tyrosine/serine phosphatase-like protein n=1 Tax=Mytilinidion resinicola TaxID=574789 RepID=A0A6A6YNT6_9PEZI|nr:tyrosine/serine phosphatase-like protein [Mytilinidion resinicola]KAF2810219.1 tyrosine/serine phosphatase-like protein [Mytilinidion resinicola]